MTKIFGIVGFKNSGKTTLVAQLVTYFVENGIGVSTIKHAHHAFDIDQPGKDSFVHREAGAGQVLISSHARWALMSEIRDKNEPNLDELITQLKPTDIILFEGFKSANYPKLQVMRKGMGHEDLSEIDPYIKAVVTDYDGKFGAEKLPLNEVEKIATFIVKHAKKLT